MQISGKSPCAFWKTGNYMLLFMTSLAGDSPKRPHRVSLRQRTCSGLSSPRKQTAIHLLWKSEISPMPLTDRRTYRRLALRWPVRLSGTTLGSVQAWTENLSASGFYCVLESPPAVGEKLECDLNVPSSGYQRTVGAILCQAEVIRIDVRNTPGFGVACKIVDFRYMRKRDAAVSDN